jgi:tripartite ATP-independent transporter DctP family solute receptor
MLRMRQLILIVLALLVASTAHGEAKSKYRLIFGGSDAVGSLLDRSNRLFCETLERESNGEVKVSFYPADQLGGDIEQIQSTMAGTQHVYGDVLVWLANWMTDFNILGWGFTFRDNHHFSKFLESDTYQEMIAKFEKQYGVKILGAVPTQPRVLFSKKPVNSLKDMENIKMRVPEIESYLRLWEAIGTRPTRVTWSEVYMALKQGVIDACEGPVSAAYASKIHEPTGNVTVTAHLISTYFLMMNGAMYERLGPDLQRKVQNAADAALQYQAQISDRETEEDLKKMEDEGAKVIRAFDVKPWQERVRRATAAMEEKGLWRKGLHDEIQKIQ